MPKITVGGEDILVDAAGNYLSALKPCADCHESCELRKMRACPRSDGKVEYACRKCSRARWQALRGTPLAPKTTPKAAAVPKVVKTKPDLKQTLFPGVQ